MRSSLESVGEDIIVIPEKYHLQNNNTGLGLYSYDISLKINKLHVRNTPQWQIFDIGTILAPNWFDRYRATLTPSARARPANTAGVSSWGTHIS
jgi:hypothetical protein